MKILIVDDHWAVRDGLKWAFAESTDVEIIADAPDGATMRQILATGERPDVVVLDIQMEGESGLEILAWLRQHHPDIAIVMLSMHDDSVFVRRSLELGASGYVLKSGGAEELARALRVVADGGMHVQGEATRALLDQGRTTTPHLSPREREILALVADGFENKQVARHLDISETTVKTHLRNAFERLDVTSRSEAVAAALRLGLID